MLWLVVSVALAVVGNLLLLAYWCWWLVMPRHRRWMTCRGPGMKARCLVVLGSGGHTSEMLYDLASLGRLQEKLIFSYLIAETDKSSRAKAEAFESSHGRPPARVLWVPRAREVGQSYLSSIPTTLKAAAASLLRVFEDPPDLVLVNGPGTAVPVALAGKLVRALCVRDVQVIYSESFACVEHLSLSGRLLYRLADSFTVQWPQLLPRCPMAKYAGRLSLKGDGSDAPLLGEAEGAGEEPATAVVTVGSTKFEALIEAVDSPEFLQVLEKLGILRLKVQRGSGQHFPAKLVSAAGRAGSRVAVEVLGYSQDLPAELKRARLVVSHAGAGTILDCLLAQRRLVVVPNEGLMANHQVQLGMALQEQRVLFCFRASDLLNKLRDASFAELRRFPERSSPVFAELVAQALGLEP